MKELSLFETVFLLAILRLPGNAYGVAVRDEVVRISRRKVPYGTLYSYLDQLFRKGLVIKSLGEPTAARGGRSKILYRVTPEGMKALRAAHKLQASVCRETVEFVAE
jgi:PadR family transcriptional regulator PadR